MSQLDQIIHRERVVIRDERGRMAQIQEHEWAEPAYLRATHVAAAEAEREQQGAELSRMLQQRVRGLEQLVDVERTAHAAELAVIQDALLASTQARADRDEQMAAAIRDAPYQLPADLINFEELAALEQQLLEVARADPEKPAPDRVLWILPREAA